MALARSWLERRWAWFMAGWLAGLMIAAGCAVAWSHSYNAASVYLLGSGDGLSALVISGSARLLIVGGSDPIALANALAVARPPAMRRVDIVVLTPDATRTVAERAVALTKPRRVLAIAHHELESPARIGDQTVREITSLRTIRLTPNLLVDIDPGLVAGQPEQGWLIEVSTGEAAITLSERTPHRPGRHVLTHAIMSARVTDSAVTLRQPVILAADASLGVSLSDERVHIVTVEPGEIRRVRLESAAVVIDP